MSMTLAEAERMVQTAKAKAVEMGVKVSIAVVDPRGDLVALVRLDGTRWTTPPIAWGKAVASATYGVASGDLTERANSPVMRTVAQIASGYFVPQQGALPIRRGDELIGAMGVSGGASQEDEDIARAGIAAL